MILELDCGNSLIKWRLLGDDFAGIVAGGVAESGEALLRILLGRSELSLSACRLVSVRSDEETTCLVGLLKEGFDIPVLCARPASELAGVRNGYDDFRLLGLDRWLAVVGAYQLAEGACLVLDFGTAVTSDFVTADGEHLGGYICPGLPLMRNQLRTHTRRIRYDDATAEAALQGLRPGRSTAEAVERGCAHMLRGFALAQLDVARDYLGDDFAVYLTGGDAGQVSGVLPHAHMASDLVFVGLSCACPLPKGA